MWSSLKGRAPRRLRGSWSRLDGRDRPADRAIHRQRYLLAVMAHQERRAIEQPVRRLRRAHLDAQTTAAEQEVEGKPAERGWQPRRKAERAALQAHATEPRDLRRPDSRQ